MMQKPYMRVFVSSDMAFDYCSIIFPGWVEDEKFGGCAIKFDAEYKKYITRECVIQMANVLKIDLEIDDGDNIEIIKYQEPIRSGGGRVPFGYQCDDGVNLTENKKEQELISDMKRMRGGGVSYRKISEHLESNEGVNLSHSGVRKILNRNPDPKTKFVF